MMTNFGKAFVESAKETGLPAEILGRRLVEIFETKKPKTRYTVVRKWISNWVLPRILPDRILDRLIGKAVGLVRK